MFPEEGLPARVTEEVGGVVENHELRPGVPEVRENATDLVPHGKGLLVAEEVADRRGSEQKNRVRPNQVDLFPEKGKAGFGLRSSGWPVLRRPALDDVCDQEVAFGVEAGFGQE